MTNLYSGKAADVIRVLLTRYPQRMTLRHLATEAGVSLGHAFNVSKSLINEGLAVRTSDDYELVLIAHSTLLTRWATVHNFAGSTQFIDYYALEDSDFIGKLRQLNTDNYALTGLFAALYVAPWVRTNKAHLYVKTKKDVEKIAKELDLRPIEGVGNVRVAIARSNGVFYGARKIDGIRIVSNVQLYVDMLNYPARGAEGAEMIYEVIEKDWRKELERSSREVI
jgi:hypothetical protein